MHRAAVVDLRRTERSLPLLFLLVFRGSLLFCPLGRYQAPTMHRRCPLSWGIKDGQKSDFLVVNQIIV